jgi:hypothetical protein
MMLCSKKLSAGRFFTARSPFFVTPYLVGIPSALLAMQREKIDTKS